MTWFYILINSISVTPGQWQAGEGGGADNERLCAIEPHLPLERFPSPVGLEPRTAISARQHFTYRASRALIDGEENHNLNLQYSGVLSCFTIIFTKFCNFLFGNVCFPC